MRFFSFILNKSVLFYKGGEFISQSSWRHKPMFHKGDYEVILCIKGPIHLAVEHKHFTLQRNDIIVLPPFTHFQGFDDSTEGVDFYWLHFFSRQQDPPFEDQIAPVINSLKDHNSDRPEIILPMFFRIADERQSLILIHQILSAQESISYIDERDYLTTALLITLFKTWVNQHVPDESAKVNYIKEWIRENISATLTVSEIADNVHLNADYLTRIFKKYTGSTTLQYLNHLKIEVASLLLIRTEMPIKQVASESYFNDSKVFTRKFKHETGLSPTEYRTSYNIIHHNNPHVDPQIPIPKRIEDTIDYIPENGDLPTK